MVIVWNGLGFMVPVIAVGSLISIQLSVNSMMGDDQYYTVMGWPKLAGFALAGLLTFGFDEWLRNRFEDEAYEQGLDPETVKRPDHSFFSFRCGFGRGFSWELGSWRCSSPRVPSPAPHT